MEEQLGGRALEFQFQLLAPHKFFSFVPIQGIGYLNIILNFFSKIMGFIMAFPYMYTTYFDHIYLITLYEPLSPLLLPLTPNSK
jgi:hypothetical protein